MKRQLFVIQFLSITLLAFAQPAPGDLYKEYKWFNESGDCRGALRVGGNLDYKLSGSVDNYQGNGMILPPFDIDLEKSIRAELVIEKMLCHGGTEGLRVSINGNAPVPIPAPEEIPSPQSAYAYHFNSVVPIEMEDLRQGPGNSFQFEVDTAGHWWPQNLLYGMILRIYYEPALLDQRGEIVYPVSGDTLGRVNQIRFDLSMDPLVEKIDLVGFYDGPVLERPGYAVELCKPYQRPKGWFTRNGEFSERFQIKGDLEQMEEAKMVFRTWSPGYFNGIYINDFIVFVKEGPKYAYFEHAIPIERYALKQGENILTTEKTPLYPEGMVHGAEVQWPGIMLLIKYKTSK